MVLSALLFEECQFIKRKVISMTLKPFQSESKRMLELMIHSIYTNKDIFLRELISNASDAIDKVYYRALTDPDIQFRKEDYHIDIDVDKENRTLTIRDTGIGMTEEELENNLGVIAKSGSLDFKESVETEEDHTIIGQFGVGFYSAFMVAKHIRVVSKAFGAENAFAWESSGADGYAISPAVKESFGTDITLTLKDNTEDDNYDEYLESYRLRSLVTKYSNYIRYPIRTMVEKTRVKEGSPEDAKEYETYEELETLNSMVPLWKKNKNDITEEEYEQFYHDKHFGFDSPVSHLHLSADGSLSYKALLYIPTVPPFDYYSSEFEKGLELYSNGVLIMDRCGELLSDHFSFVRGVVDSEDLSLNISREMLQHDRQLHLIGNKIETRVKDELTRLLNDEREKYEEFYKGFGKQLKFSVYKDFGMHKEQLQDLLLFYSSAEKKQVTLKEYVAAMPEDQKFIYYATGSSIEKLDRSPQGGAVRQKGYDILYFTDEIDEFAIKMIRQYEEKEFRSVSSEDLGLDDNKESEAKDADYEALLSLMKEHLGEKVANVKISDKLQDSPVCFSVEGELSIEMEKAFRAMNNDFDLKAQKILEINPEHPVFQKLVDYAEHDKEKLNLYTDLLYEQALLIEGLPIDDPVEFSKRIGDLM